LYVTFVSFQENEKGDRMIAFRFCGDPDGGRGGMQYLEVGLFPLNAPDYLSVVWTGRIQPEHWPEIIEQHKTKSLRQLAKEWGVSHGVVRRTLRRIGMFDLVYKRINIESNSTWTSLYSSSGE
jgi:hypothetical protein